MAGEDNGALITKFDEVFNGYIDHEVIKAVLQYCQWDAEQALQSLLGMVEVPENVLVRALAISTSIFEGTANSSCLSRESEEQQISNSVLSTNGSRPISDTQESAHEEVTPGWSVWPGLSSSLTRTHSCIPATKASAATFKWSEINEVPPPPSTKSHGKQNLQDIKESTNAGKSDGGNVRKSTVLNCVGESLFNEHGSSGKTYPVLAQERQEPAWPVQQLSGVAEAWYPSSSLHYTSANNTSSVKKSDRSVSKKDEIKNKILLGDKLLVLMRGLPGSGKSTLAQEITGRNGVVLSTDDFHYDKHGSYNYKPSRVREAHGWNTNRTLKHLREGTTPIIIDNTNLQKWEMNPYIQMAIEHGYEVDILEPSTSWRLNSSKLAKRNIHNVPKTKIKEMKERYQKDLKIEDLISQLRLSTPERSNASSSNSENYAESSKLSVTKESSYEDLAKHKPATGLSVIKHYMRVNSAFYENEKEEDDYEDDVVIESSEEEEEGNSLSYDTSKDKDVHQHLEIKDVLADQKFEGHNDTMIRNTHEKNVDTSGMAGDVGDEDNYDEGNQEEADVEEKKTSRLSTIEEQRSVLDGTVGQDRERKGSDCKEIPKMSVVESIAEQPERDDLDKETGQQTIDLKSSCKEEISLSPILMYNDLCSMISKAANTLEDNGEEWKDVLSDETPSAQVETIEDANFSDLVQTFNKALRFQLDTEIYEAGSIPKKDDSVSDDLGDAAMYNLISDMEDKLGRPLSSLVTRPSGKGEELQLLNFSEIGQNMIRDENNHQEDHEPSVVGQYTGEGQLCSDSVDIGTNVDGNGTSEKKEDGYMKERMDGSCSWGCLDTQAMVAATWEEEKQLSSELSTKPQPSRNSRRREGDKLQWLKVEKSNIQKEVSNDEVSQWKPVLNAETTWDQDVEKVGDVTTFSKPSPPMERERQLVTPPPQSGAVPKRKATIGTPCSSYSPTKESSHTDHSAQLRQDGTSSEVIDQEWNMPQYPQSNLPVIPRETEKSMSVSDKSTQTLSQDFQVLVGKSSVYGNMMKYANVGGMVMNDVTNTLPQVGPLTKHKLRLDKSTMTVASCSVVETKSLQNLTAFFPSIPEDHLKDVLEKCRYDLDWAMNLLLDGGYEMADSVPDLEKEVVEDDDWKDSSPDLTESYGTESTGDDKTSAEYIDSSNELSDHQGKKLRQSQRPDLLATKKAIEETVTIASKLDDRGNRLTGGQCSKKNRVRSRQQTKTTEKTVGSGTEEMTVGSRIEKVTISLRTEKEQQLQDNGNIDGEDESGLISLTMDPLFASQLVNLFGPIGPYKIDNLTEDDYNVILPVSLCRQVYQLWSKTLEGKFHHESEVMDSYIKDDQQLAEQLQAEENARVGKRKTQEEGDIAFQVDPPNSFKEIMELEEALAESRRDGKGSSSDSNLSHRLNILRLQEEYSHLDPNAIEEEFKSCDYNYKDTVELIQEKYGSEGYPKTVIAPEAMHHYEQVMLEKAKALSLKDAEEQQKLKQEVSCEVNDPQVYREEAIAHYQQRQNAFRKAQEASQQGMKAVAAYYAQIGNLHATRLREANKRASEKILEAVNSSRDGNTLDLHYLHVTEAVSVTQAFLSERQRLLRARNLNTMHVSLITGRGANSEGGVARIKPAVKEFLQKNGYSHVDANSGMVVVTLKQ